MSTAKRTIPSLSQLEDHIGYWLRSVSNHVSHSFGRRLQSFGVTTAEWVILRQACNSAATSVSRLARETGLTRGAISKLVDRLVAKGLLVKAEVATDKRRQKVGLTLTGRRLVPRLAAAADDNDHYFFAHLSTRQRRELIALLREAVTRHGLRGMPVD